MQWDDLRVFLTVAQAGSLRKSARALRLGQPTIGRDLHQLERTVGARLVERSPNGHRLTREGQKLLPLARSMAAAAAANRSATRRQLEAFRAGAGLGILPCFVGDADASLLRLTPPIEEVEADYWLLVHPDLKTVPRVRHVMERIRGVFKASRAALRGSWARARGDSGQERSVKDPKQPHSG